MNPAQRLQQSLSLPLLLWLHLLHSRNSLLLVFTRSRALLQWRIQCKGWLEERFKPVAVAPREAEAEAEAEAGSGKIPTAWYG